MSSHDFKASTDALPTLSTMTTVTLPEKTALSNVTTSCTAQDDRSPRPSDGSLDKQHINPFESDLEANNANASTNSLNPCGQRGIPMSRNPLSRKSDNRVWPGKDHWKQKAKAAKMKRSWCGCLAGLSARNKIIAKVLIILLIVGIGVSVGFGISKPLNAPIWE